MTSKLQSGDTVEFKMGNTHFYAEVVNITSTQKAQIRALTDFDSTFNTDSVVNTYRKFMTKVSYTPWQLMNKIIELQSTQ